MMASTKPLLKVPSRDADVPLFPGNPSSCDLLDEQGDCLAKRLRHVRRVSGVDGVNILERGSTLRTRGVAWPRRALSRSTFSIIIPMLWAVKSQLLQELACHHNLLVFKWINSVDLRDSLSWKLLRSLQGTGTSECQARFPWYFGSWFPGFEDVHAKAPLFPSLSGPKSWLF
jgi:hypothetical protein